MSALGFLALAVVLCLIGVAVVLIVHRRPKRGTQASIDAFNRQLEVLGRSAGRPVPEAKVRRVRRRARPR